MKILVKKIVPFLLLFVLSGCWTPRYDDNYPPSHIRVKKILEGDHTENYYWTFWDKIWTPKGDTWLKPEHLKWLKEEPKDGDWENIYRKALLLHENAHCINDHQFEYLYKWIGTNYSWLSEREGYEVQIRYLILRGVNFNHSKKISFVNAMTSSAYNGMASREEVIAFVDEVVENAEALPKLKVVKVDDDIDHDSLIKKSIAVQKKFHALMLEHVKKQGE